jgi:hypothetical protein
MAVELSPEVIAASTSMTANGLYPTRMPLPLARNLFGGLVADSGGQDASDNFFISTNPIALLGGFAESGGADRAPTVYWEFDIPPNYVAGEDLTIAVKGHLTGGGTLHTRHQVDVRVWKPDETNGDAVQIGTLTDTALAKGAVQTFSCDVTGAGLQPGGALLISVGFWYNSTGGDDLEASVYAVIVS